jgi:hypothetical protein
MEITQTLLECIRENVRDTLELLADAAAQQQYEWDVERDDVPAELVGIWSNATYIPNNLAFERAFTPPELADLATFDNVMRAAAAEIGLAPPQLKDLHALEPWQKVMRSAGTTLKRLRKTSPD